MQPLDPVPWVGGMGVVAPEPSSGPDTGEMLGIQTHMIYGMTVGGEGSRLAVPDPALPGLTVWPGHSS